MEIKYNVEVPKSDSEDINALFKFVESDRKTMQITYEDVAEAKNRRSVLQTASNRNDFDLEFKRIGCDVYISKVVC